MGKKGKWFGAVKKVFSPESKEKKEEVMLHASPAPWISLASCGFCFGFVGDIFFHSDLIGFVFPPAQFRRIQ
jgi:hypothetical protein